jgi:hypothetical protein
MDRIALEVLLVPVLSLAAAMRASQAGALVAAQLALRHGVGERQEARAAIAVDPPGSRWRRRCPCGAAWRCARPRRPCRGRRRRAHSCGSCRPGAAAWAPAPRRDQADQAAAAAGDHQVHVLDAAQQRRHGLAVRRVDELHAVASGRPRRASPPASAPTMTRVECRLSEPPRRITALPDFRHRAPASAPTLGRDS